VPPRCRRHNSPKGEGQPCEPSSASST
jgi:hypothetical protein